MKNTATRIKRNLIIIIILTIFLCLITFTAAYANAREYSHTINLNDGLPIIEEYSHNFAPGTSIEKEFFIENRGDQAVYYRLFFEHIDGPLGQYLDVEIYDHDELILEGKMKDLTKSNTHIREKYLNAHERKNLKAVFTMPKDVGDAAQNATVEFDLKTIATWAKENY